MKTIIQVVQHLRPGGIETMALDLQKFKLKNEQVFIVSLEDSESEALQKWPRLKAFQENLFFMDKKPGFRMGLIFELKKLFKKLKVDYVHTHHIGPLIYAGLAARLGGIKDIVHTEHDAWHLNDAKRRNLQKWVVRLVRPTVIADAHTVASNFKKHLNTTEPKVILNGIDTQKFTPGSQKEARDKFNLPQGVKLIGTSGRLEAVKGQEYLIDAICHLPHEYHLAIAGIGSLETDLKTQVRLLNLSKRVHFLGLVDDMPDFYRSLDLFCLPSLEEGMPLSTLEAQSCGVKTIATNAGGTRETVCPITGYIIEKSKNYKLLQKTIIDAMTISTTGNPRDFVVKKADVRIMAKSYASLRLEKYREA